MLSADNNRRSNKGTWTIRNVSPETNKKLNPKSFRPISIFFLLKSMEKIVDQI